MSEDRPLISDRSPTYERAREARGQPAPRDARAVAVLSRLYEAELDAARALRRAGDAAASNALHDEAALHEQNAAELGARVQELGGSPPRPDELRPILAHGAGEVERVIGRHALDDTLRRMREELAAEREAAARDDALTDGDRAELSRLRS